MSSFAFSSGFVLLTGTNQAARVAEESAKAAQAAQEETLKQFAAAQAFLEEVKSKSGTGQGTVWWLQRELEEKKSTIVNYMLLYPDLY